MKMIMKLVGSLSLTIWLSMVLIVSVEAQITNDPVYDTDGEALQAGATYYILSAEIDGLPVTPIRRNNTCPFYVGQDIHSEPVVFTPFEKEETVIREDRELKIEFVWPDPICNQSSYAWMLDGKEPITEGILITTGNDTWPLPIRQYFRIHGTNVTYEYSFRWCFIGFNCQDVGYLVEDGKQLLALGGTSELPVKFKKFPKISII